MGIRLSRSFKKTGRGGDDGGRTEEGGGRGVAGRGEVGGVGGVEEEEEGRGGRAIEIWWVYLCSGSFSSLWASAYHAPSKKREGEETMEAGRRREEEEG